MLTFAVKIIINQKHKMKKFYSLFLFVVAALFGVTAQAQRLKHSRPVRRSCFMNVVRKLAAVI